MKNIYRGFIILEECPNEDSLEEFTVFVWQKNEYYKSELYKGGYHGGYIGFGDTKEKAFKKVVDCYWEDIDTALDE